MYSSKAILFSLSDTDGEAGGRGGGGATGVICVCPLARSRRSDALRAAASSSIGFTGEAEGGGVPEVEEEVVSEVEEEEEGVPVMEVVELVVGRKPAPTPVIAVAVLLIAPRPASVLSPCAGSFI